MNKKNLKLGLSITFLLSAISFVTLPLQSQIVSPRLTIPVVLLPGAEFSIELRHTVPFVFSTWRARLSTTLTNGSPASLIDLNLLDTSIGFSSTTLRVRLPASIAPGRYTLAVSQQGQEALVVQENSVHVRGKFSADMTIVQLADLPTLGGDGSGDKQLATIVEEINIINPDVVMFSGDLAYGGSWDQYERLLGLLKKFDAPVIAVPGNHAYYGWGGYLHLLGKPYHYVNIGDYQFISLNSGHGRDQLTYSQLAWFTTAVKQPGSQFRVLQLHHPIQHRPELGGYLRANRQSVLKTISDNNVAIVLSGHWHGDSVYDQYGKEHADTPSFEGTPFVVTTTAGADLRPAYSSSEMHHGYRLIRFIKGELESYTYDYDGDGVRDAASSIPFGKLTLEPRGRFAVLVKNQLNEGFLNARIRISVPDANGIYYPSLGKIERIERQENASLYTLLVDLPANRESVISMIQEGYKD